MTGAVVLRPHPALLCSDVDDEYDRIINEAAYARLPPVFGVDVPQWQPQWWVGARAYHAIVGSLAGGPLTSAEICRCLRSRGFGYSDSAVRVMVSRLYKHGVLNRDDWVSTGARGSYWLKGDERGSDASCYSLDSRAGRINAIMEVLRRHGPSGSLFVAEQLGMHQETVRNHLGLLRKGEQVRLLPGRLWQVVDGPLRPADRVLAGRRQVVEWARSNPAVADFLAYVEELEGRVG